MQGTGILVLSWPIVLGCDASSIVAEVGERVSKFKDRDIVFGCTRLGHTGYGNFQEYVSPEVRLCRVHLLRRSSLL
jgi:NADPH:quinone reductase-like Zn-dependent oxidoreductase